MAQFTTTESLGATNTTSSTPSDKLTHSVTSPTGRKYIIFFACDITVNNVATRAKVDLYVDGSLIATFSPRQFNANEVLNVFFFEQVTGKTANFDCKIQISSTNNSNQATISNARIVAWDYTDLEDDLDLHYGADNTNRSLPASFDDNGARVSFTPPSTGNYFVLGAVGVAPGSTTVSALVRMLIDGTSNPFASDTNEYGAREAPAAVTDAFYNFNFGTRQSLASGASRTIEIEARNESGTTGTWQYSRVLAFREDAFVSSNYAEADTASTYSQGQSTSYNTRATVTTTDPGVDAKDYLILAGGWADDIGDTAENERGELTITVAGTQVQELEERTKEPATAPSDFLSLGHASLRNDAAAFTVLTRIRAQGSPTDNDVQAKNSWIIILRDDVIPGTPANSERAGKMTGFATANRENQGHIYGGLKDGSFADSFDNTTYKDGSNTTASWVGDGQIKYP